jgi:hypothetical protein
MSYEYNPNSNIDYNILKKLKPGAQRNKIIKKYMKNVVNKFNPTTIKNSEIYKGFVKNNKYIDEDNNPVTFKDTIDNLIKKNSVIKNETKNNVSNYSSIGPSYSSNTQRIRPKVINPGLVKSPGTPKGNTRKMNSKGKKSEIVTKKLQETDTTEANITESPQAIKQANDNESNKLEERKIREEKLYTTKDTYDEAETRFNNEQEEKKKS